MTSVIVLLAAGVADAAGAEARGSLPQFDFSTYPSQIFWLAVTFGTLYVVMTSIVLPRLGGVLEERRDRIADDLDQAAEYRREAETAEADYRRALNEARARAQAIAAETRAGVEADLAKLQAEAAAQTDTSIAEAEARIAKMKSEAASKVQEAASDVARGIVAALIDETPTDEAVAKAIASAVQR